MRGARYRWHDFVLILRSLSTCGATPMSSSRTRALVAIVRRQMSTRVHEGVEQRDDRSPAHAVGWDSPVARLADRFTMGFQPSPRRTRSRGELLACASFTTRVSLTLQKLPNGGCADTHGAGRRL